MKKYILLIVIFLFGVFVGFSLAKQKSEITTPKVSVNRDLTVIVSGYGSKSESGEYLGENAPFLKQMKKIIEVSSSSFYCQSVYEGTLYGQKILSVTTGMAKVNTTACIEQVLDKYGIEIKEVIVVGTAGITPAFTNGSKPEPAMVGDVCISYLALDFDLQYYTSDQKGKSLASPQFWHGDGFTGRETVGSSRLANELYNSSLKVTWPEVPQEVRDANIAYHAKSRKPKVWNSYQCAEVTSDLYWNDIKADKLAREEVADLINRQSKTSYSPDDVLVVTSMEALPVGLIIEKYNKYMNTKIEFAYVRSASNFDHAYLAKDGTPADSFRENSEMREHAKGSEYAIEASVLPVLEMFKMRATGK